MTVSFLSLLLVLAPSLADAPSSSKGKAAERVKVGVAAKRDADGKVKITVVLDIDDKVSLFANDVPEDALLARTRVDFSVQGKAIDAKIAYPAGTNRDKLTDCTFYQGKVTIVALMSRPATDMGPLEVTVKMWGFFPTH